MVLAFVLILIDGACTDTRIANEVLDKLAFGG